MSYSQNKLIYTGNKSHSGNKHCPTSHTELQNNNRECYVKSILSFKFEWAFFLQINQYFIEKNLSTSLSSLNYCTMYFVL